MSPRVRRGLLEGNEAVLVDLSPHALRNGGLFDQVHPAIQDLAQARLEFIKAPKMRKPSLCAPKLDNQIYIAIADGFSMRNRSDN